MISLIHFSSSRGVDTRAPATHGARGCTLEKSAAVSGGRTPVAVVVVNAFDTGVAGSTPGK
jgi:hypothetical protein